MKGDENTERKERWRGVEIGMVHFYYDRGRGIGNCINVQFLGKYGVFYAL
jgi:hypothetical protein